MIDGRHWRISDDVASSDEKLSLWLMMRKTSDVMRVEAAQANVEGEQEEEEINILYV